MQFFRSPNVRPSSHHHLKLVSVEGNWDDSINDGRLASAAALARKVDADFILTSGTYAPDIHSDKACSQKLGRRNQLKLCARYNFPSTLIFPAYNLPFEYTYTTIAAFGNACILAWLGSGFSSGDHENAICFYPISSREHFSRVWLLNKRALRALDIFKLGYLLFDSVGATSDATSNSEESKVAELLAVGGVLSTGQWMHDSEILNFESVDFMKRAFRALLANTFSRFPSREIDGMLNCKSLVSRFTIATILCSASWKDDFDQIEWDDVYDKCTKKFPDFEGEISAVLRGLIFDGRLI